MIVSIKVKLATVVSQTVQKTLLNTTLVRKAIFTTKSVKVVRLISLKSNLG